MSMVVAIDGPAGSGKSSVSRAVAGELGYAYLDTGAAYRSFAWFVQNMGIDPDKPDRLIALLPNFDYTVTGGKHLVGQVDVTKEIRSARISQLVSDIARVPEVRSWLNKTFREQICAASETGIVAEGRDVTTVIAPDAQVRILLTANEQVRIARRARQLDPKDSVSAAWLASRDRKDATVVDFFHAAAGVVSIDSTDLSFDQTVQAVITLVRQAKINREEGQ